MIQAAAEPYETIAFRVPAYEIEDANGDECWNGSYWDPIRSNLAFSSCIDINCIDIELWLYVSTYYELECDPLSINYAMMCDNNIDWLNDRRQCEM